MKDFAGIEELGSLESCLSGWFKAKSKEVLALLEGRRVLDVGCGIGGFTRVFVENGFEVVGTDTSPKCLSIARKTDARFFLEDITNLKNLAGSLGYFDTVTGLDVIEHVEDDVKAIKNIRKLLKANGVFVMTVPAFSFLYSKHDAKIGHYRRYSKSRVKNLLTKNGFKIEKIFYWNFPGIFGWFACKLLNKNPVESSNQTVDKLYKIWFKIEGRIKPPIGLTIFVKARKI